MIPHYTYSLGYISILGWAGHAGVRVKVSLNH